MSTPIDIDNTPPTRPFLPQEWIGCGKEYPNEDTPQFILAARKEVLAIPSNLESSLLPSEKLSVLDFLQVVFPQRPSTIVTPEATRAFRFEEATDTLASLASRPLPSIEFIGKLQKAFGSAWFGGARSVVDERFKESRLPLYVITYWVEMNIAVTRQETWRKAKQWLQDALVDEVDGARKALALLGKLEWGSRVIVLNADANTETFATLLSNDWLDDQNIDMLMEELKSRIPLDPELAHTTAIFPLVFQQIVHTVEAPIHIPSSTGFGV